MKRPSILLAIFVVALLGFITFNSVSHNSAGSKGLPAGSKLPPFAMPLSTSSCTGPCDADIAIVAGEGTAGHRPACEVRGAEILNSCELAERGPFVLAFVFQPIPACRDQLAGLERVAARFPGVRVAVVAVRADAAKARSLGSKLPVGYDHDGAVANEYAVVVCPTITYVARDGRVAGSTVGPQDDAALTSWVRKIALSEPPIVVGEVDPAIVSELPGLGLRWCEFAAGDVRRRSPPALRERIRLLSDRAGGAQAIAQRTRAIPSAYRVLFRHLGMEPDTDRIPVEAWMLERLRRGAYPSTDLLSDALMVATIETEVGVWACAEVPRLALVDGRVMVAGVPVFSSPPVPAGPRLVVFALVALGVPEIAVEEALWTVWDIVTA